MRFVALLVVAVFAVIVAFAVLQFAGKGNRAAPEQAGGFSAPSPQRDVGTADVLVARVPVAVGTVIDESMVDVQPWPQHLVLEGFVVSGQKDSNIVGRVARADFQAREPFMAGKLANPNDPSFLAAGLPAGKRAVTIATDAVSGVAGFVFPGDRVDIVFTHNVPGQLKDALKDGSNPFSVLGGGGNSQKAGVAEVLIPDVRVLAVNLRQVSTSTSGSAPVTAPSSVTMEVTEEGAQKLRLAERAGTLSLSLRSLKDEKGGDPRGPTRLPELTRVELPAMLRSPDNYQMDFVRIVRGANGNLADFKQSLATQAIGQMVNQQGAFAGGGDAGMAPETAPNP